MPFLALVHLRDLACAQCGTVLATAGARSFVVDAEGAPVAFAEENPPAELVVDVVCPNGHATRLFVPNEISAEEALSIPDDAPLGCDATLESATTGIQRGSLKEN